MSYEGYEQYLCKKGHLHEEDALNIHYEDGGKRVCPHCGEEFEFRHSVDQTNGYDTNYESTCEAPMDVVGFTDVWNVDHYGNRYATKLMQYRPVQNWDDEKQPRVMRGTYEPKRDVPNWPWVNIAEERAKMEEHYRVVQENRRWCIVDYGSEDWPMLSSFDDKTERYFVTVNRDEVLIFDTREAADSALQRLAKYGASPIGTSSGFMVVSIDLREFGKTNILEA